NGVALVVISIFIFAEAARRLHTPVPIQGTLMLAVASAGFVANLGSAFVLHRASGHNLNVRGAYLHVLGDLAGAGGAIAAAVIILTTGWLRADPLISVIVGVL